MYGIVLLLHVLAATVWTGGHLVLAMAIMPRALKEKSPSDLLRFEVGYERIGIPALIIQVVTGVWLSYRLVPDVSQWIAFDNPVSNLISAKLCLLLVTLALAVDARLRIIPKLSADNLSALAWHIVPITAVSVLFVVVGVSFRTGWLF
jgi:putative copper export protein